MNFGTPPTIGERVSFRAEISNELLLISHDARKGASVKALNGYELAGIVNRASIDEDVRGTAGECGKEIGDRLLPIVKCSRDQKNIESSCFFSALYKRKFMGAAFFFRDFAAFVHHVGHVGYDPLKICLRKVRAVGVIEIPSIAAKIVNLSRRYLLEPIDHRKIAGAEIARKIQMPRHNPIVSMTLMGFRFCCRPARREIRKDSMRPVKLVQQVFA